MIVLGVVTHSTTFVLVGILLCCSLSALAFVRRPQTAARIQAWRSSGSRSARMFYWLIIVLTICAVLHTMLQIMRRNGWIE